MTGVPLLSLTIFLPLIGALLILLFGAGRAGVSEPASARMVALWTSGDHVRGLAVPVVRI